jgi:transcriptional antiterminator NusG
MLMIPEKNLTKHALALAEREWGISDHPRMDRYLRDMVDQAQSAPEVINGTWYIVVVEPQQEGAASGGLIGRRFATYFPQQPKSIRSNYHKRRVVMRPMLPGYVLVSFDVSQNHWKRINSVSGVRRILMVDERPVPVPESALYWIRKEEARAAADFGKRKRTPIGCKVGDWVQITEHFSFTGYVAQVVEILDGKGRIRLLVDLFGRKTPVEVSAQHVRVV